MVYCCNKHLLKCKFIAFKRFVAGRAVREGYNPIGFSGNTDSISPWPVPAVKQSSTVMNPYLDMYVTERSMPSLPEGLKLIETVLPGMHHFGLFCSHRMFPKGTRFGPYTGNIVGTEDVLTMDRGDNWEVSLFHSSFGFNTQYGYFVFSIVVLCHLHTTDNDVGVACVKMLKNVYVSLSVILGTFKFRYKIQAGY